MSKQPEALRLADWLDTFSHGQLDVKHEAAAELRRLNTQHQADQLRIKELETLKGELVDALRSCRLQLRGWMRDHGHDIGTQEAIKSATSVIDKVKAGESNE